MAVVEGDGEFVVVGTFVRADKVGLVGHDELAWDHGVGTADGVDVAVDRCHCDHAVSRAIEAVDADGITVGIADHEMPATTAEVVDTTNDRLDGRCLVYVCEAVVDERRRQCGTAAPV